MGIILTRTVPTGSLPAGAGTPINFLLPATGLPTGFDTLVGTPGADTLGLDIGVEGVITALGGNDSVTGAVTGRIANMFGGKGNDTMVSLGGFTYANGNKGNDSIYGNNELDSLRGGQDNDTVVGGLGADTLHGDLGNDLLVGSGLATGDGDVGNTIYGGDGTDTIYGGVGSDLIYGGQGNDLIDVNPSILIEALRTVPQRSHSEGNDRVFGDLGNDTIGREDAIGNKIYDGGDGDDSVVGGTGDDSVAGSAGSDTLRGGNDGDDTIVGGDGNDSIQGGNEAPADPVGSTTALVDDSLLGGRGNDTINGNQGRDSIDGGIGDDSILGGDDGDFGFGDDQADTLRGEAGNDSLAGGRDNDVLEGARGSDTLTGGLFGDVPGSNTPGEDVFEYNVGGLVTFGANGVPTDFPNAATISFAALAAGGADLIRDFTVGSDRIRVAGANTRVDLTPDGAFNPTDVSFGRTFSTAANVPFGVIGSADFNIGGQINTVIYIETFGALAAPVGAAAQQALDAAATAGFDSRDVVLAVLEGVGAGNFDPVGAANFIFAG